MIVVAQEMKDAVDHVQHGFLLRGRSVSPALPDGGLRRDDDFPLDGRPAAVVAERSGAGGPQIERQDIGRMILVEKFLIERSDDSVGDEDQGKIGVYDPFMLQDRLEDLSDFPKIER